MPLHELSWLAAGPGEPAGARPGAGKAADPAKQPFGRRVLITEDNWLIALEWEAALQDAGYEVVGIAVSGEEALRVAAEEAPDLVVMDIRLFGEMDGVDAAVALRARTGVRCVFVSAHDDPEIRRRAELAEPLGWISKPVVSSRLADLIAQLSRRPS